MLWSKHHISWEHNPRPFRFVVSPTKPFRRLGQVMRKFFSDLSDSPAGRGCPTASTEVTLASWITARHLRDVCFGCFWVCLDHSECVAGLPWQACREPGKVKREGLIRDHWLIFGTGLFIFKTFPFFNYYFGRIPRPAGSGKPRASKFASAQRIPFAQPARPAFPVFGQERVFLVIGNNLLGRVVSDSWATGLHKSHLVLKRLEFCCNALGRLDVRSNGP